MLNDDGEERVFHIFDFFLINELGHSYEYDLSVIKELESRKIETNIYVPVHSSIKTLGRLDAVPLFRPFSKYYGITKYFPPVFGKIYSSIHESIMLFVDLMSLDNAIFSKTDSIFIPTLDHRQLLSVIWWFKRIPKHCRPRLILLFHFEENIIGRKCVFCPQTIYRIAFFIIEKNQDLNIMIATDSNELSQKYQLMTKKKVTTFPIPHIKKNQPRLRRTMLEPVISYLGEARLEKGFHLLPGAISYVFSNLESPSYRFVIQMATNKQHDDSLIQETKKQLRELTKYYKSLIQLAERDLREEEYHDFLLGSDILLLPYLQKPYRLRTSGIFAEGMGLAKLMVIPEKTWMYRQVQDFGGVAMSFEKESSESLGEAIIKSINYFEKNNSDILISSSERWNSFHNPGKLVDLLMGTV